MKLYRTANNTVVNLEEVEIIHPEEEGGYSVETKSGNVHKLAELTDDDIDRIMEYNSYLLDEK